MSYFSFPDVKMIYQDLQVFAVLEIWPSINLILNISKSDAARFYIKQHYLFSSFPFEICPEG